jgi:hypothetical protein
MKRTLVVAAAALAATLISAAQAAPPAQTLTMSASATTVRFGDTVTLTGKLIGAKVDGRSVTVRQDPFPIDGFANAGTATTNAGGDWSFSPKPEANTRYQARAGKADSPTVDVMVRPAISLRLSDRTPRRGQLVRFSGRLCPEHDGVAIALQRRGASGWRTVASPLLKDLAGSTCSRYSRRMRVRRDRTFRARFLGDENHVAGNSRRRRADVH